MSGLPRFSDLVDLATTLRAEMADWAERLRREWTADIAYVDAKATAREEDILARRAARAKADSTIPPIPWDAARQMRSEVDGLTREQLRHATEIERLWTALRAMMGPVAR